ncbi:hypothetical protein G1O98_23360 [Nostoc sp. UIC10630]|nr:hypothetical protein [Nostoc sp. UIC 10630]
MRSFSDTLTENSREEKTAHAPLGGASPQTVESVKELEEELPAVTDCTSLALVEAAPSQPAPFLAENQVFGVEAIFPHKEICSAAPVAQNEFSSSLAIANQTPGQVEQGNSALLSGENQVFSVEVKVDHEGEGSALPVPQSEKWSHEAIVTRSNLRPERMQKLKTAGNSGQSPGFEYLLSCWQDDPALQIVIKKLLAKFPHWGIACVDGVLVDWER